MTQEMITSRNNCRLSRPMFWGVIFTVALLYGLMSYLTPPQYDDLMFIGAYRANSGGSDTFSPGAWAAYCNELAQGDNRRLGNLLSPFTTLFSPTRQLFPWLNGIVFAAIIVMSLSVAGIRRDWRGIYAAVLWLMLTIALPWRNNIFVADYSLNYIWASAIALGAMILSLGYLKSRSLKSFAAASIALAITGWWHEGFALPIAAAMCCTGFVYRGIRTDIRWWIMAAIAGGSAIWAISCPGMLHRIGAETGMGSGLDWLSCGVDLFMVAAAISLTAVAAVSGHCRATIRRPDFTIMFVTMLAASVMSVAVVHSPRTAFWPELCASVVVLMLCNSAITGVLRRHRRLTSIAAIGCWTACMAQMSLSLLWQSRFNLENRQITAQLQHQATVFADITMPEDVPVSTLRFPARSAWLEDFNYSAHEYAMGTGEGTLAVVPTALRTAGASNSVRLGGDAGVYRCGNALWTTDVSKKYRVHDISGNDIGTPGFFSRKFITLHGDTLVYLKFYNLKAGEIGSVTSEH